MQCIWPLTTFHPDDQATYDSYSKLAAKSIAAAAAEEHSSSSSSSARVCGANPTALAKAIADGADALHEVEILKGAVALAKATLARYKDLFFMLHGEFSHVVDECGQSVHSRRMLSAASVERMRLTLSKCIPDDLNKPVDVVPKGCRAPETFEKLAKEVTDMGSALRDYISLQDFMMSAKSSRKRKLVEDAVAVAAAESCSSNGPPVIKKPIVKKRGGKRG